ncbi:MAG: hypothetical protein KIH10_16325 [Candidatus Freyarchaeota archaeon]|nr:hypothetical protein [Candidatus Jordarchaeia archaeon]MBS7281148.1 hypothetical protein [Candidatus Jordarchaeia archaeon]
MAEKITDADTGNEVIHFVRRGKHYFYLRDATTKRFIKRLKTIEVRYYMVVDYSKEQARKGNPLYIDAGAYTQIKPEEYPELDQIENKLKKPIENTITKMFGKAVTDKLLEDAGVEYGSKPNYPTQHEQGKATVLTVWKHRPEELPRKKEEEATL